MRSRPVSLFVNFILCFCFLLPPFYGSSQLPENFYQEEVAVFNQPVGITFDDRGFGYIWEKGGVVWVMDTNEVVLPEPFLDLSQEVAAWRDHGLLGFALDPDFLFNGHVYCMYTMDRHHLFNFNTPQYSIDSTTINQATVARITRFTADSATNFMKTPYNSRKVLLGETMDNAVPIPNNLHGIGSLAFGDDGSLLASTGDGGPDFQEQYAADFHVFQAIEEGILLPQEVIGPYRTQLLDCLNGKILRIDPLTGDGLEDNPWYDEANPQSVRSKVWTLGIRNPFRMKTIPGSGAHEAGQSDPGVIVFGDVGEGSWEEINIIDHPGLNCGWPLYEGFFLNWGWFSKIRQNQYAPNPLYGTGNCDQPFFTFHDLLLPTNGQNTYNWPNPCDQSQPIPDAIPRFYHHLPVVEFSNKMWNLPERARVATFSGGELQAREIADPNSAIPGKNFGGFSAMAGFWYEKGALPEVYDRSFWIADYSGWIRLMKLDEDYQLVQIDTFAQVNLDLVDLAFNLHDQSIYFPEVSSGKLFKIAYGLNPPPVPVVTQDTIWGTSPLTVLFDGSLSYHPKSVPFDYSWDFGDGSTSDEINPTHTFSSDNDGQSKSFVVNLVLTDSLGMQGDKQIFISVNNTPPVVQISTVQNGDTYAISAATALKLDAEVTDLETSNENLSYNWQTFLHHNAHFHPEPVDTHQVAYSLISPLGCDGDVYYFRVRLEVKDPQGLTTRDEVTIYPNCDRTGVEVELEAAVRESSILLFWDLPNIPNAQKITIQRVTFQIEEWDIGTIDVNGAGDYSFEDLAPQQGLNNYRLKLHYTDGSYDYSNFVNQSFPLGKIITIFPNPVSDNLLTVQIADINGKDIEWRILNMDGKLINEGQILSNDMDAVEEQINVSAIPNGIYLIEITVGEQSLIEEILIKR